MTLRIINGRAGGLNRLGSSVETPAPARNPAPSNQPPETVDEAGKDEMLASLEDFEIETIEARKAMRDFTFEEQS
jgi:hypothetical protein